MILPFYSFASVSETFISVSDRIWIRPKFRILSDPQLFLLLLTSLPYSVQTCYCRCPCCSHPRCSKIAASSSSASGIFSPLSMKHGGYKLHIGWRAGTTTRRRSGLHPPVRDEELGLWQAGLKMKSSCVSKKLTFSIP